MEEIDEWAPLANLLARVIGRHISELDLDSKDLPHLDDVKKKLDKDQEN